MGFGNGQVREYKHDYFIVYTFVYVCVCVCVCVFVRLFPVSICGYGHSIVQMH